MKGKCQDNKVKEKAGYLLSKALFPVSAPASLFVIYTAICPLIQCLKGVLWGPLVDFRGLVVEFIVKMGGLKNGVRMAVAIF